VGRGWAKREAACGCTARRRRAAANVACNQRVANNWRGKREEKKEEKEIQVWPEGVWPRRKDGSSLQDAEAEMVSGLRVVGYADDTTVVARLSSVDRCRKAAEEGYSEWGHTIHTGKWQRLWTGCEVPPPSRAPDRYRQEAKVLGCVLEADGGYSQELEHRITKAGAIWRNLIRRLDLVQIGLRTKGRLFRATVLASLLYGTEVRGITAQAVRRMQTVVNQWERRIVFGPAGGTRDMVGKCTQADVKVRLGNPSVQLAIDERMLRYVGHVLRMPPERWERRLLLGFVEGSPGWRAGTDPWWDRMSYLIGEVRRWLAVGERWNVAAGDKGRWAALRKQWWAHRLQAERQDTQAARAHVWGLAAEHFSSRSLVTALWEAAARPRASGTSLEGLPTLALKRLILAGGVSPTGWVAAAPASWRVLGEEASAGAWLAQEGVRVRRRLLGKRMSALVAALNGPAADDYPPCELVRPPMPGERQGPPPRKRLARKQAVLGQAEAAAAAPPPGPALPIAPPPRRRIVGKQPDPQQARPMAEEGSGWEECPQCGLRLRISSVPQHKRLYCPARDEAVAPVTRGGRKALRPTPPVKPKAEPPALPGPVEFLALGPLPSIHVRWTPRLPQAKRNPSSLPAGPEPQPPPPVPKRPSKAPPPPPPQTGCFATCGRCNQCSACRRRVCNGRCVGCSRCRTCREWGERLAADDAEAVAAQAQAQAMPPVAKRGAADPGNAAKKAAVAGRPADAPKGATQCPYCKKWLAPYHRESCPSMPYAVWIAATRHRQELQYGPLVVASWKVQCQHCATPFPSPASKRVHLAGCERRRNQEELPLNQYPALR
jgi:hypothetical protein